MNSIETLTPEDFRTCKFWNRYEDTYISRDHVKLHRYAGSLLIMDIADAMKPGKICEKFTFNWWPHDQIPAGIDELFAAHNYDTRAILATLRALPWQKAKHHRTGEEMDYWQSIDRAALVAALPDFARNPEALKLDINRGDHQAIRIFSPFAQVNPLPHAPKKWTVAHVVRALMAGQFRKLKCNGVYTDDYAFDAGADFQRGEIKNAVAFARRIMESPSGWWASAGDGGIVSICCHHFDSNEFTFDINARHPSTTPVPLKLEKFEPGELSPVVITTTETPAPKNEASVTLAAPRVEFNREKNGVEIHFHTKPDATTLASLKANGWRWSRFSACWYAKRNSLNVTYAAKLAHLTDDQAQALFANGPSLTPETQNGSGSASGAATEQPAPAPSLTLTLAQLAQRALAQSWSVF